MVQGEMSASKTNSLLKTYLWTNQAAYSISAFFDWMCPFDCSPLFEGAARCSGCNYWMDDGRRRDFWYLCNENCWDVWAWLYIPSPIWPALHHWMHFSVLDVDTCVVTRILVSFMHCYDDSSDIQCRYEACVRRIDAPPFGVNGESTKQSLCTSQYVEKNWQCNYYFDNIYLYRITHGFLLCYWWFYAAFFRCTYFRWLQNQISMQTFDTGRQYWW